VRAYLATIGHAESVGLRRVYGAVLHRFADHFAAGAHLGSFTCPPHADIRRGASSSPGRARPGMPPV